METTKKTAPAYTTYKSFQNFVESFREDGAMPTHLSRSTLPGSNSGKATMAASLRALGLLAPDESPTELMKRLVEPENDYSDVLKEVLYQAYDFLTDPEFDLENTTTDKMVEKFKELGANGSTVTKCMAFFLSASSDAHIAVSKYVKAPPPQRSTTTKKTKIARKGKDHEDTEDELHDHQKSRVGMEKITVPLRGMEDGIIFFPEGLEGPDARKAVRAAIFNLNSFYELGEDE